MTWLDLFQICKADSTSENCYQQGPENHMIVSTDVVKEFDKLHHPFVIKKKKTKNLSRNRR